MFDLTRGRCYNLAKVEVASSNLVSRSILVLPSQIKYLQNELLIPYLSKGNHIRVIPFDSLLSKKLSYHLGLKLPPFFGRWTCAYNAAQSSMMTNAPSP